MARPNSVRLDRDLAVPMRDGTVLRADVYRPSHGTSHPVMLERTANNKRLTSAIGLGGDPLRFAEAGYAVVAQDTRGRFASDGEFYPFRDDVEDGYDTIAWCAEQRWSNGAVGMFGVSYVGTLAWFAAAARPPNLVTILPTVAASDAHEGWAYRGGAFELGLNLSLILLFYADDAANRRRGRSAQNGKELAAAIDGLARSFSHRPLADQPTLTDIAPYYFDWLEHPDSAPYWRPFAIGPHFGNLDLPAFHAGGWYDIFLNGTLANFVGMRANAATDRARNSQRLLIGPWSHGVPWLANPVGDVDFGHASTAAAVDLQARQIRWCDYWLKGVDDGVMDEAPIRIFVMGTNEWRDEYEWPLVTLEPPTGWPVGGSSVSNPRKDL